MYTSTLLTAISIFSAAWAVPVQQNDPVADANEKRSLVTNSIYHSYASPYSFDLNTTSAPKWMSSFPDSTNLTSLSIPGTHDTMTATLTNDTYQCQNHYLETQLSSGLRYFDIRGRVVNDTLQIYHQDSWTGFSYSYVLSILFAFLDANPSEVILMRFKEEAAAINSTLDFETMFNYYRLNDSTTAPGCAKHFWIPATPGPTSVPTLGDLRSKILILQNFGSDPAPYGIKWESPLLEIEDLYEIDDVQELPVKWDAVRTNIEAARSANGGGQLFLSHTSASVGVLPIQAAAGPLNKTEEGINDYLGDYLKNGTGTTGVILMDFPGGLLTREILVANSGLNDTWIGEGVYNGTWGNVQTSFADGKGIWDIDSRKRSLRRRKIAGTRLW